MSEAKSIALKSFFGVKAGMTRIFDNDKGIQVPVTVIKLIPNIVTRVKTEEKDGYAAYQVGYGEKREKLVKKPVLGALKKNNINEKVTRFFEIKDNEANAESVGAKVNYEGFDVNSIVDVTSISKGKGFAGVMKRYGFQGGPATHGSHFHRTPGSIGNRATPGRVFAQKKMPGHMGAVKKTQQNLPIVEVNLEEGYLLVKGSIPGAKNSFVKVSRAIKTKK
jgi:large subunit ribosomal protein L3